jgi:hypothetical protein
LRTPFEYVTCSAGWIRAIISAASASRSSTKIVMSPSRRILHDERAQLLSAAFDEFDPVIAWMGTNIEVSASAVGQDGAC